MAEYIEREALLEDIKAAVDNGGMGGVVAGALKRYVKRVPAADVAPVVHGRWEWREEWDTHPETHSCDLISCGWYCTECGIELGEYLTEKTGQRIILDDDCCKPKLTICPNCGAKMDLQ